jgi:hypothetical protein
VELFERAAKQSTDVRLDEVVERVRALSRLDQ